MKRYVVNIKYKFYITLSYIYIYTHFNFNSQLSGLRTRDSPCVNTRQTFKIDECAASRVIQVHRLKSGSNLRAMVTTHERIHHQSQSRCVDRVHEEGLPARISAYDFAWINRFAHFRRSVLESLSEKTLCNEHQESVSSKRIRTEFEADLRYQFETHDDGCTAVRAPRAFCRDWRMRE